MLLRDPLEAAADVAKLVELVAFAIAVVRWRRGGPPPSSDSVKFWGNGAEDLVGEFAGGMPALVNSVPLRVAGKVARMVLAVGDGAVSRAVAAQVLQKAAA